VCDTQKAESGVRSEKSGADPDGERGEQRKDDRVGNGVQKGRMGWKERASDVVDRVEPTVQWQRPDLADRTKIVVRRKPFREHAGVVDRVEAVFREHAANREVSVVRVEWAGLLEVEDEVGHADEDAEDSGNVGSRKEDQGVQEATQGQPEPGEQGK
jgi:hypothetical protein